jgi:hypothetical protein
VGGACGAYVEEERYVRVLVGECEGRRPWNARCRWEDAKEIV